MVQPQPVWEQEPATFNGTGFFLATQGQSFVITASHFIEQDLSAVNFWSMQGQPLLQARYTVAGTTDSGTDGAIQDLTNDLVISAVPRVPPGYLSLEADPRQFVPPGERVWLPNKRQGRPGYARVEGRITNWDPGYIEVELDHPIGLHSQSGSPIISVQSGKVIGVLSRGNESRLRLTPLWVTMGYLHLSVRAKAKQHALHGEKHAKADGVEASPRFAWPDAEWPLWTFTPNTDTKHPITKQVLQSRTNEAGVRVVSLSDGNPWYTLDISKDGDVGELQFSGSFAELVKRTNPELTQQQIDTFLDIRAHDIRGDYGFMTTNWAGETFRIGADYERELTVNLYGVEATMVEALQATRFLGCTRVTKRRCVELKSRREFRASELARVKAELSLKGDPRGNARIPNVHHLVSVTLEEQGMIPHAMVIWSIEDGDEPDVDHKLVYFDHPDPPEKSPSEGPARTAGAGQPSLPEDLPPGAATPSLPADANLETFRAQAKPLVLRGPGPEARPVPAPAGAQEVVYSSGALQLRGWLAQAPGAAASPVVVHLHDGFSAKAADWAAAQAFLSRGYSVFVPQFRGESGNPGEFSAFLHEVDDAIAAGSAAAGLPGVDPKRVYLVGKGHGGALALLVAELPNPFAAVAAIDPIEPIRLAFANPLQMPFDTSDVQELAARDPFRFPGDLRTKVLVLSSTAPANRAQEFCAKAGAARCSMGSSDPDAATSAQAIITTWQ